MLVAVGGIGVRKPEQAPGVRGGAPGEVRGVRAEDLPVLEPWSAAALAWSEAVYLRGYLGAARGSAFVPKSDADTELLLDFYLLEKSIYEIAYELDNRPDWLDIPLRGLERLLGTFGAGTALAG